MKTAILTSTCALVVAATANAGYTVAQTNAAAPTYANTLNFDEAGGPTGVVPANGWTSYGLTTLRDQNAGTGYVAPGSSIYPWMTNTTNVMYGTFGIEIVFETAVTDLSFQLWTNGGNPSPFGGGSYFYADNDDAGNPFNLGNGFNGAWGGIGNSWFDIHATGGDSIKRLFIVVNTFGFPEAMLDNLSWNTVPGPGAAALLALGLAGRSRRRA